MGSLFLILLFSLSWAQKKNCDPATMIQKACQHFNSRSELMISTHGGKHRYFNPVRLMENLQKDESSLLQTLKKYPRPDASKVERVQKLFDQAKTALIEKIKNGIPDEKNLTPEKKSLIARLRAVELNEPGDVLREQIQDCAISKHGAFFVPANMKISLCPMVYDYPDAMVNFIIGHEMAHAMDPCLSKSPVFEIEQGLIDNLPEDHPAYGGWARFFNGESETLKFLYDGEMKRKVDLLGELYAKDSPVAAAVSSNKHPYLKPLQCLKNAKKIKGLERKKTSECEHNSENEIYSDIFGAWYLGEAQSMPFTDEERMALIASLDPGICMPLKKQVVSDHGHPPAVDRMSQVVLQMPGVKEKMGCGEKISNTCFQELTQRLSAPTQEIKTENNQR